MISLNKGGNKVERFKLKHRYTETLAIRISESDKERINQHCIKENVTRGEFIRQNLKTILDNGSKETKAR
jgi:hypothetical protein